jgi:hypothetical protein
LNPGGHWLPQEPQFMGAVMSVSQPSSGAGAIGFEQLALPGAQDEVQTPPLHATMSTLPSILQPRMQAPQLRGSVSVSDSQPLNPCLSQSAKVPVHIALHFPPEHVADALGGVGQPMPHIPQLFTSVAVSTSQPVLARWSQLAKPLSHFVIAQWPLPSQVGVAWSLLQAAHDGSEQP